MFFVMLGRWTDQVIAAADTPASRENKIRAYSNNKPSWHEHFPLSLPISWAEPCPYYISLRQLNAIVLKIHTFLMTMSKTMLFTIALLWHFQHKYLEIFLNENNFSVFQYSFKLKSPRNILIKYPFSVTSLFWNVCQRAK